MKSFRLILGYMLYIHISGSNADLSINVSPDHCDTTIELTQHQAVYLDFEDRALGPGGCTYTVTNGDSRKEICLKENPQKENFDCVLLFKYRIGGRPSAYGDHSCYDFMMHPFCTNEYKVYANFHNSAYGPWNGINLKAHVVIYLRSPPPTTTRRTYTYANSNSSSSSSSATLWLFVGVPIFFVVILLCICGIKRNNSKERASNRDRVSSSISQSTGQTASAPRLPQRDEIPTDYNWDPPAYNTIGTGNDQSYYGLGHISGHSPYTVSTGTTQARSSEMITNSEIDTRTPSYLDKIDLPPSYESLDIHVSHL